MFNLPKNFTTIDSSPIRSERIEFLFNLVLFALDEASEQNLDAAACLLDQAALAIQPFRTQPLSQGWGAHQ
jgi:hypothetical protein